MIRVLASDGMNKAAAADLRAKGYEVVEQFYEPEDLKKRAGQLRCAGGPLGH